MQDPDGNITDLQSRRLHNKWSILRPPHPLQETLGLERPGIMIAPRHACEQDGLLPFLTHRDPALMHGFPHSHCTSFSVLGSLCTGAVQGSHVRPVLDEPCATEHYIWVQYTDIPQQRVSATVPRRVRGPKIRSGRFDDAALDVTHGRVTREEWAG